MSQPQRRLHTRDQVPALAAERAGHTLSRKRVKRAARINCAPRAVAALGGAETGSTSSQHHCLMVSQVSEASEKAGTGVC